MKTLTISILLLACLTVLFGFDSFRTQEIKPPKPSVENPSQYKSLFSIRVNGKIGFIDRTGKIIIEPAFQETKDFVEGRAIVGVRDDLFKIGYLDEAGNFAVIPQFDDARNFSEGLAAVGIGFFGIHGEGDHKWGFIDRTGQMIIEPDFRESRDFSEGFAAVMNDEGKWGFTDKTGKVVIPFQFEDAFSFSEGLACVLTEGLFGFIDKSGKIVIAPRFIKPGQFEEDLASVNIGDKNAKPFKYDGYYVASKGELVFIDKAGNTVLRFDDDVEGIANFSEGLARIVVKRKENEFHTVFIDKTGQLIFELPFDSIRGNFSEGLALIEHNGKYGFIDKTGKMVIKPVYSRAEDFHNGLARISTSKQNWDFSGTENLGFVANSGYIDKTGKVIWQPTK